MRLWIDTETRSSVPIKRGVYCYKKQAPDSKVIIVQWAVDDGPVQTQALVGVRHVDLNPLMNAIGRADEIWAHEAQFDRVMLTAESWWPRIPLSKWRCTAALARMHGLPGGLDKLSTIFKLGEASKHDGYDLIRLFCIPKKDGTYNDAQSHPVEWAEFLLYAGQDVEAMRGVWRKCPKWNATPRMWAAWHLDQRMNDRGVCFDLELAHGAIDATTAAKADLAQQALELTGGAVESTTQRDRLLRFLAAQGVVLPDLTADTVNRRLEDDDIPEGIKELLRVRQQASKASTAKYKRVITHAIDGRLHGLLLFCGAARTGRWAGRLFQPQNLPRPKHKQALIDAFIAAVKAGCSELIDPEDTMGLAASALRGLIVSAPGKKLVAADYANIEGRICAWLAGEQWKLDAFRAYDAGTGPDLYCVSYASAFNILASAVKDPSPERQIGKVLELFMQYYGGVGAFCNGAETYGIDLDDMAAKVTPTLPKALLGDAAVAWLKAPAARRYELKQGTWMACWCLVQLWRKRHQGIVKLWHAVQDAVHQLVAVSPQAVLIRVPDGPGLVFDRQANWLRIRLPSGRYLSYPSPKLDANKGASFVGVNPYTKQWSRIKTYSGKLVENIVQGIAADLLIDGLLGAEAANYNPILSVHDEVICETTVDTMLDRRLSEVMISNSPWAAGLPLAAKGFVATRYQKK